MMGHTRFRTVRFPPWKRRYFDGVSSQQQNTNHLIIKGFSWFVIDKTAVLGFVEYYGCLVTCREFNTGRWLEISYWHQRSRSPHRIPCKRQGALDCKSRRIFHCPSYWV